MEKGNSKINTILLIVVILLVGYFVFFKNKAEAPVENPTGNTQPALETTGKAKNTDLIDFSIKPGQEVSGKVDVTGKIEGAYFFEANIRVNILGANKNVLKEGHGEATSEWMTVDPVSFKASLDFTGLPKGLGFIEIHNDNASDLPENDKSVLVPIIIS